MDSIFFHCLARELGPLLAGKRVEKVFGPAPGVLVFALGARAFKRFLVLKEGRGDGLVFVSEHKPANPPEPAATVMWLRKRLVGRRLLDPVWDGAGRRLAWGLTRGDGRFLVLDLVEGVQLLEDLEPYFTAQDAGWPELERVLEDPDVWREYPQISPVLRATLAAQPPARARALLGALSRGSCGGPRVYLRGGEPSRALAWALPDSLTNGEQERVFESYLDAAAFLGQSVVFPQTGTERRTGSGGSENLARSRAKRIRRTLRKLERETERLDEQAALEQRAEALKAALYALQPTARLHRVQGISADGEPIDVELDASLTVLENMERYFRLAARARRGQAALQARRIGLQQELEGLLSGDRTAPPKQQARKPGRTAQAQSRKKNLAVHRFRTDDGFLLLRGKNSAANHKMLTEAASPFDYWFHAQDGPGAHLILKRDHPGQDVPPRSMEQAAALAALKSWQADSPKANVMCAVVKDVRKVKGAPLGMVHVDKVLEALHVDVDAGLEERLRVE